MKRLKRNKKPAPGQELFVKNGKGMLRLKDGQVIKGGEEFIANPDDIPEAFRDTITLLNQPKQTKKTFKETGVVEDKKPVYKKVQVRPEVGDEKGLPLFNIVDKQGKVVNEEPVSEEDADQLLKELNPV